MINQLTSLFSPPHYTLFILAEKVAVYQNGQPRLELALQPGALPKLLRQVCAELRPRGECVWAIGLPLHYFSIVRFNLPEAASDNMEEAVRYALMRHVPFDLDKAYVDFHFVQRENALTVTALVALKEQLRPLLNILREEGILPYSIFPSLACLAGQVGEDGAYLSGGRDFAEMLVLDNRQIVLHLAEVLNQDVGQADFLSSVAPLLENVAKRPDRFHVWECAFSAMEVGRSLSVAPDRIHFVERYPSGRTSCPFQITLAPASLRRKHKRWMRLQVASLIFLLVALISFPVAGVLGKRSHLTQLEQQISQIRPRAELIAVQRRESQETFEFLEMVARQAATQPLVAELLQEVSQVLPPSAWLESFVFAQNRIRIQGQADSATAIIEALENSPLLRDVRFESPVTKSGTRDVFQISAEVE